MYKIITGVEVGSGLPVNLNSLWIKLEDNVVSDVMICGNSGWESLDLSQVTVILQSNSVPQTCDNKEVLEKLDEIDLEIGCVNATLEQIIG